MRKSYREINPMRLKFAVALVDQKDERKPFVLVISDQKLLAEKWKSEGFLLLPSNF
jgi:hypothetical protein